ATLALAEGSCTQTSFLEIRLPQPGLCPVLGRRIPYSRRPRPSTRIYIGAGIHRLRRSSCPVYRCWTHRRHGIFRKTSRAANLPVFKHVPASGAHSVLLSCLFWLTPSLPSLCAGARVR